MLEEALLRAIVAGACQAGEVEQNRNFCARFESLRRKVEIESHIGISTRRLVLQFEKLSAERGDGGCGFERHDETDDGVYVVVGAASKTKTCESIVHEMFSYDAYPG